MRRKYARRPDVGVAPDASSTGNRLPEKRPKVRAAPQYSMPKMGAFGCGKKAIDAAVAASFAAEHPQFLAQRKGNFATPSTA